MLIQYNICGNLIAKGSPVRATYTIKNLDTEFISKVYISAKGFYNINLANFPDKKFKDGDIVSIEFSYTDNGGIDYYTRIAVVINDKLTTNVIDAVLVSDWKFTSQVNITQLNPSRIEAKFTTGPYTTILFKLYYKFNNIYQQVKSATITDSSVILNFPYSGEFMLIGYIFYKSNLLSYSQKEFNITAINSTIAASKQYIEWE